MRSLHLKLPKWICSYALTAANSLPKVFGVLDAYRSEDIHWEE